MKTVTVIMDVTVKDSITDSDLVALEDSLTNTAIESLEDLVYYDVPKDTHEDDIDDSDAVSIRMEVTKS